MLSFVSVVMALAMLFIGTLSGTQPASVAVIGGSDGPTAIFVGGHEDAKSVTISFDANITTGFEWTYVILGGDSAAIDESASGYVSDPAPEGMCGVGGTHYFKVDVVKPGETLVRFVYSRGWEDFAACEKIVLFTVDSALDIVLRDVTDAGVLRGTVTEVNERERTAMLLTDGAVQLQVLFGDELALPVKDERVTVYTNGTAYTSVPIGVKAIAWESVPEDRARQDEDDGDDADDANDAGAGVIDRVVDEAAACLMELANDEVYIGLYGASEEIREVIALYAQTRDMEPVSRFELSGIGSFAALVFGEADGVSPEGQHMLDRQIWSGRTVVSTLGARDGVEYVAAGSILSFEAICDLDIPCAVYVLGYENDVGVIVGIWNDGGGLNTVSAGFIPHVSRLGDGSLAELLAR